MHVASLLFFFTLIYLYLFIHFSFCFACLLACSFILVRVTRELNTLPQIGANKIQRVRLDGALYRFFFLLIVSKGF